MTPFLLITGDFLTTGGMDRANHALALHLAHQQIELHLVAHRVDPLLLQFPNVHFHHAPRPLHSHLLGSPFLRQIGLHWARRIADRGGRVLVNGGNCPFPDANWLHYLHAAWTDPPTGSLPRRFKNHLARRLFLAQERSALSAARLVIANSEQTRCHALQLLHLPPNRVRTIYLGLDPLLFHPATESDRLARRQKLGWPPHQPILLFLGALGDRRKGFDTLFDAWKSLSQNPKWDPHLAVIGSGPQLPFWKSQAANLNLTNIHFLGFRSDVPDILSTCDALVAPSRYEPYGMAVAEALASGIPAFVSARAGVAERYPATLRQLLLLDPDNPSDLAQKLQLWRGDPHGLRAAIGDLSQTMRSHTWQLMAQQIADALAQDP